MLMKNAMLDFNGIKINETDDAFMCYCFGIIYPVIYLLKRIVYPCLRTLYVNMCYRIVMNRIKDDNER